MILFLPIIFSLYGCGYKKDMLLQAPYNQITYITNPGSKDVLYGVEVSATTYGVGIVSLLPDLYKKILELNQFPSQIIEISNITITGDTRDKMKSFCIRSGEVYDPVTRSSTTGCLKSVERPVEILYKKVAVDILEP